MIAKGRGVIHSLRVKVVLLWACGSCALPSLSFAQEAAPVVEGKAPVEVVTRPPVVARTGAGPAAVKPKRTPASALLLKIEPERAPAGAVVEVVALPSVDLEKVAEEGGYVSVDGTRVELLDPKDSRATIKLPSLEGLSNYRQGFVSVRLVGAKNESVALRLNLFPPEKTNVPPDSRWKIVGVRFAEKEMRTVLVELADSIPVEYWGKVKVRSNGVELAILKMHDAAIKVQLPKDVPDDARFTVVVDRFVSESETLTLPPLATASSAELEKAQKELRNAQALLDAEAKVRAIAAETESKRSAVVWWLGATTLAGFAGMLVLGWRAYRKRIEKSDAPQAVREIDRVAREPSESLPKVAEQEASQPTGTSGWVPEVPEDLRAACAAGECVLFVGGGLAAQAGMPTWPQLLSKLATDNRALLEEAGLGEALAAQELDSRIAEVISARVPKEQLIRVLKGVYDQGSPQSTSVYETLKAMPLVGAITNGWDRLLPKALQDAEVVTPRDGEQLAGTLRSPKPFLFRLFGDLDKPETFIFTDKDLETALYENETAQKALVQLVLSRTVFFVGTSIDGIDGFMSLIRLRSKGRFRHFALVPRQDDTSLETLRLSDVHNVELIAYGATSGHPQVAQFLENLRDSVKGADHTVPVTALSLQRLRLKNIGPFKSLDLAFKDKWNVLLGNNGCGKSTVLRAIAVGLCGDGAKDWPSAANLLRTGEASGSIELIAGNTTYQTNLVRDGDKVTVLGATSTPLAAKQWLALGFPPLRGSSLRESSGPGAGGSRHPQIEDVKPLIVGGADSRMDDLKQWVINLSVTAEGPDKRAAETAKRTRQRIFELLAALTPGVECSFSRLERNPWRVWVKTQDAEVPFGLVSQGTHAVFGWVGTLLLRLYEIHRSGSGDPETTEALVLVDEIDAHMHPEWQQMLVPTLRRLMPQLQVIATTHSPLIVGSTQSGEVQRFNRLESGEVQATTLGDDILTYRADQVLTSSAFSLASTRGDATEEMIAQYSKLLEKTQRSMAENTEVASLRDKLRAVLTVGESPLQREVEMAVEDVMDQLVDRDFLIKKPEIVPAAKLEATRQLLEIMGPKTPEAK